MLIRLAASIVRLRELRPGSEYACQRAKASGSVRTSVFRELLGERANRKQAVHKSRLMHRLNLNHKGSTSGYAQPYSIVPATQKSDIY